MSSRRLSYFLGTVSLASLLLAGCASSNAHREESRNKIVQTSKIFCEFVNGDNNPDIDVAVNLAVGAKCDADRSFSMTSYRTPSEINGILYCCGVREPKSESAASKKVPPALTLTPAADVEPVIPVAPKVQPTPAPTQTPTATPAKVEERKPNRVIFKGDPDLDE